MFLLVNLCPLMSFQTSYLLLLTSPSESVPASHVPPVEAVPEHTAPPSWSLKMFPYILLQPHTNCLWLTSKSPDPPLHHYLHYLPSCNYSLLSGVGCQEASVGRGVVSGFCPDTLFVLCLFLFMLSCVSTWLCQPCASLSPHLIFATPSC